MNYSVQIVLDFKSNNNCSVATRRLQIERFVIFEGLNKKFVLIVRPSPGYPPRNSQNMIAVVAIRRNIVLA
jgi:hypothetical protein